MGAKISMSIHDSESFFQIKLVRYRSAE